MGKRKRKFIDKKKAITFRLVSRSQQDPLIVDEKAPQNVLVPVSGGSHAASQPNQSIKQDKEARKKELHKFGVFFDDDYDYLQHLREPGKEHVHWEEVPQKNKDKEKEKPKIQLPSSVFASEFEEDVGYLNKAIPRPGPRPDWDPDIVEALDDDFDFDNPDNQLDDNFMEAAMGGADDGDYWEEGDESFEDSNEEGESDVDSQDLGLSDEEMDDELGPLPHENFDKEETKSRFTEYSMSSSVIRRNAQLTLLDDRFEKFFEHYDDPEVGALECEEIEGHVEISDEILLKYAEEFDKDERLQQYDKNWDVCRLTKLQEQAMEGKEEELVEYEVEEEDKKVWDCESVLSKNSNIYNHPKLLADPPKKRNSKIQINPKTGMPVDGDRSGKLTQKTLAKLDNQEMNNSTAKSLCAQSVLSTLSVLSIRPKDETPEEKKERKKLLKDYRNERRIEKKANKIAFKEEQLKQQKIKINASVSGTKLI